MTYSITHSTSDILSLYFVAESFHPAQAYPLIRISAATFSIELGDIIKLTKIIDIIYTFEGCKIPAPSGYPERPVVTVKSQPQTTLHKCIPMLNGSWSKSEGSKIKIWDESAGKYGDAIKTGDFLTCFYGGIISVLEVPNVNNFEFAFGDRARALLKYIELPYPPYSNAYIDYFIMDGDSIKEIYFQYAGDWGITIGWGTYIPTIDGHNYDVTEEGISILKKYGMTNKDISHVNSLITKYKDADKDNRKVYYQEIKKYIQSKKLKVPIADCNKYFEERLAQHENRINKLKMQIIQN